MDRQRETPEGGEEGRLEVVKAVIICVAVKSLFQIVFFVLKLNSVATVIANCRIFSQTVAFRRKSWREEKSFR